MVLMTRAGRVEDCVRGFRLGVDSRICSWFLRPALCIRGSGDSVGGGGLDFGAAVEAFEVVLEGF